MTSGAARLQTPGAYYAFSIEELLAVEPALEGDWPCAEDQ